MVGDVGVCWSWGVELVRTAIARVFGGLALEPGGARRRAWGIAFLCGLGRGGRRFWRKTAGDRGARCSLGGTHLLS